MSLRKRVLFIGEAVTLAHVSRPLVLAQGLDPSRYEVHFACADRFDFLFRSAPEFTRHTIDSVSTDRFLASLEKGEPLYDRLTLERYVEDDLRVLDDCRPDVVVGDFRLSLAVSATLRKTPYIALANAHWSPYSTRKRFPAPEHAMNRVIGVGAFTTLFNVLRPAVFSFHARPLNAVRKRYGLTRLNGMLDVYTFGDYTAYLDHPAVAPIANAPENHLYLGPVIWSPEVARPDWWESVDSGKRTVYVTLGSSGQIDVLPSVLAALKDLPVITMLATAGRASGIESSDSRFTAEFLPGLECAQRADMVICNGGSATVYQSLSVGTPVLGIPANLDQYLTMTGVAEQMGGVLIRAGSASPGAIRTAIRRVLDDEKYGEQASRFAEEIEELNAVSRFVNLVNRICD